MRAIGSTFALITAMIAVTAVSCGGDDGTGRANGDGGEAGSGLYVAYVVPQGEPPGANETGVGPRNLHLQHPGGERTIEGGFWLGLAWAPDGSALASLRIDVSNRDALSSDMEATLSLREPGSGETTDVSLQATPSAGDPVVWAPDASRLAIAGPDSVAIVTREGEEVGTIEAPGASTLYGGIRGLGQRPSWSPDSQHLVVQTNEAVLVVDRDGETVARTERSRLQELVAERGGEMREGAIFGGGWTGSSSVELAPGATATMGVLTGTLEGGELSWEASGGSDTNRTPPNPRPEWAPTGEGEQFAGGYVTYPQSFAEGLDAAWLAYHSDGTNILVGAPEELEGAETALLVHHQGELTVFEPDIAPGWLGGNQFLPFDVAQVE